MIITEYNVLNNIRKKLEREKQDALDMMMSTPVEKTHELVKHQTTIRFVESLLNELEQYAKALNNPDFNEDEVKNFFGEK